MPYQKFICQGNLTRNNELKYLPSGTAICNNSIAVSSKFKKQDGSIEETTMFMEITIFGKRAETFNQYTHRGSKVLLDGKIEFQQWTDQQGQKKSRHILKVEDFTFLDSKQDNQQGGYQPQQQQYPQQQQQGYNPPVQAQGYPNNTGGQTYQQGMNQQGAYDQSIPEIDIDNDEIPHSKG